MGILWPRPHCEFFAEAFRFVDNGVNCFLLDASCWPGPRTVCPESSWAGGRARHGRAGDARSGGGRGDVDVLELGEGKYCHAHRTASACAR
eukprot:9337601-Pyramimonas_sp.AAC.1